MLSCSFFLGPSNSAIKLLNYEEFQVKTGFFLYKKKKQKLDSVASNLHYSYRKGCIELRKIR